MPDLIQRRGYFKTGNSKVRLSLLEDTSTGEGLETDWEQTMVEGVQSTGTGGNTEYE